MLFGITKYKKVLKESFILQNTKGVNVEKTELRVVCAFAGQWGRRLISNMISS
jgi:hypothetical protein